jgi:hypothetical protein
MDQDIEFVIVIMKFFSCHPYIFYLYNQTIYILLYIKKKLLSFSTTTKI